METSSKTQIKVGIFVMVGILATLISIYLLGGDRVFIKKYYALHAHFDQVQGLAPGSVVSLSGMVVGNISNIAFAPEVNALDVTMKIDEQFKNRITLGSTVEVRTQGALGDKFIYIIPGPVNAEAVPSEGVLKKAEASDFLGVLTEKGDSATKVFEIIDEIHKMAKVINHENRLDHIMQNFTTASENLNKTSQSAQQLLSEIRGQNPQDNKLRDAIVRLDSILVKLDRGEGSLGALINDPALHEQLKSMLGGSARSKHVKSLIRSSIEKSDE